jgi:hypothetical protein
VRHGRMTRRRARKEVRRRPMKRHDLNDILVSWIYQGSRLEEQ